MIDVKYILSDVLTSFCYENNINVEDISKLDDITNRTVNKINPLVGWYGVKDITAPEKDDVCIKDVVGWDPCKKLPSLLHVLSECYADSTELYRTRANEKLSLGKDKMLEEIQKSLSFEEVWMDNIDGKYVITVNGCHRTSMLRLLYLDDLLKGELSEEELNKKYTIKSRVSKYDMTLTYVNYCMQMISNDLYISIERNKDYTPTGEYRIGNEKTVTRDELLEIFSSLIKTNGDRLNTEFIRGLCDIPSFKEFASTYLPTLLKEDHYGSLS